MFKTIYQSFDSEILSIAIRLFMATLFGGMIGLDRGLKKRPAGLRTFALVCVGSSLAMITNEYLYYQYHYICDPARMAAQVISGIGFLGAGTIIVTGRQQVKGLTTAASLWATASMGIAIGAKFYWGAILSFIAIYIAITVLHIIDNKMYQKSKVMELYIETNTLKCIPKLIQYIRKKGYSISSFEKKEIISIDTEFVILLELNLKQKANHNDVITEIGLIEEINLIEEIR